MVIVRREIRKRGFVGKLIKAAFILFNVLMLIWLVAYLNSAGNLYQGAGSDSARSGTAIGATLGTGFLVFFWMAGDLVLGLFVLLTRGKLTIIEERQG